ncbi:MAG: MFS transporter [Actinomycetota bacterium]|nr:MFS transporter [Actinomycetota bacterium]
MTSPGLRLDSAQGRWLLAATVLGSSLAMLDATVVNVALGRIGTELDAGFAGLQWTLNGYTLTLASFILLGGSLGDRLGRRRIFVFGTVWFAVASLLCGIAPNVELLVLARALQGVGGALLTPGSLAIISASLHPDDRARAIGAWSGLGGLAAAVGPFLGGYLIDVWSWRLIFLINLPLAAVVVVVAVRYVPETVDPEASPRLDLAGCVLGALGLAGLTYALIAVGDMGWTALTVVTGAVGVLSLAGFLVVERRSDHPLVPLDLFASLQFTAANLVTFVVYGAMGGLFFLLVLDLQVVAGFSPLVSGTALLPITVLMLFLSSRAGAVAQRIGPRLPMTVGPLVCAGGVLLMLRIGRDTSYVLDVLPAVTLFGLGLAITVAPLTATVLASAADRHAGVASGVNNAVARAAGLMAVAVLPAIAGLSGEDYQRPDSFADGFTIVLWICAALLAIGGVLSALTIDRRLQQVEPARPRSHCAVDSPPLHVKS